MSLGRLTRLGAPRLPAFVLCNSNTFGKLRAWESRRNNLSRCRAGFVQADGLLGLRWNPSCVHRRRIR